jgi:hypothetical protein
MFSANLFDKSIIPVADVLHSFLSQMILYQ